MSGRLDKILEEALKKSYLDGYQLGFRDGYNEANAEQLEQPQPKQSPLTLEWVGLTQEEFEKLIDDAGFTRSDLLMMGACVEQIIDLVEAKLKEKNG